MSRNLMTNLNINRETMTELQNAAANGKEVSKSSDDPVRFAKASRFRKTLSQYDQYSRNINDGSGWVDNNALVMNEFHALIVDARSIAIQGSDASQSEETRQVLSDRVDDMIEESVATLNSTYLGKSIFSGTDTQNMEPFEYDGSNITYTGNEGKMNRRISEGLDVEINITGSDIESTGVFTSLVALRDALAVNDDAGVADLLQDLQDASDKVLSLDAQNGLVKGHMQMTSARLETSKVNIQSFLSETEDADLAEVIMEYNGAEMAYEAALQVTSKALQLNIMDFLR